MSVISIQEKLQRGRRILSKAGNDPDLLSPALTAIHGALEDACRGWLATPEIRRQHNIDVLDNSKASWKVLLELMPRYCGWSSQDVKYVSKMNYLRNQTAHGGSFEGTRQELDAYLDFVERAIANGGGQYNYNRKSDRNTQSFKSQIFKKIIDSKYSFPFLWLGATFLGFVFGIMLGIPLTEAFGLSSTGNSEQMSLKQVLEASIILGGGGLGVGFLQAILIEKRIANPKQWIVATSIGYATPAIPLYLASITGLEKAYNATVQIHPIFGLVATMIVLSIYGATIGYWQWLVLRLQFRRAKWWIVASTVGYGVGFMVLSGLGGLIMPWILKGEKVSEKL